MKCSSLVDQMMVMMMVNSLAFIRSADVPVYFILCTVHEAASFLTSFKSLDLNLLRYLTSKDFTRIE